MIATYLEISTAFGLLERELEILAYIMFAIILIPVFCQIFKTVLFCFIRPRTCLKAMLELSIIHTAR